MNEELAKNSFEYTGKVQPKQGERDIAGHPLYPYLPDSHLIEAVNLAIYLKRPLLIKGEPGCGKTRLALAVAYELKLPYVDWHIKSTSRARDGFYTYDSIGRLRDAQLAAMGRLKEKELARIDDPSSYIRLGPLGQAFQNKQRSVVLIDEIDKADIDFPNDLLLELDERRFTVEETGQEIQVQEGSEPIIFITSNDEKELPEAFLRRCLFYYIPFPLPEMLVKIVYAHFPEEPKDLIDAAVKRFSKLRKEIDKDKGFIGKKVTTSELIDWFNVLRIHPEDVELIKLEGKLPYASVLLKSWDDHARYLGFID